MSAFQLTLAQPPRFFMIVVFGLINVTRFHFMVCWRGFSPKSGFNGVVILQFVA
jgi:hypothetical protein